MINLGDRHNGKCVVKYSAGFEDRVFKPRCVFWEYLFLDASSPLRNGLFGALSNQFFSTFGNLPFKSLSDLSFIDSGETLFVPTNSDLVGIDLKQLSGVLVLALVFGISDLHVNNVKRLIGTNRVQILDLECLFEDFDLLQSCYLAPAKWMARPSSSFLGQMFLQRGCKFSFDELKTIVLEVLTVLNLIIENSANLISTFDLLNTKNPMAKVPIRVLLRPTQEYATYLDSRLQPAKSFIEPELAQLKLQDIPYFWTYLNSKTLYWFSNNEVKASKFEDLASVDLRDRWQNPRILLKTSRLERLKRNIVSELVANCYDAQNLVEQSSDLSIECSEELLIVKTNEFKIKVI